MHACVGMFCLSFVLLLLSLVAVENFDFFHQSKVTVKNMPNDCDRLSSSTLVLWAPAADIYGSAMKML